MFHMLACFNLRPEENETEFRQSVAEFTAHLTNSQLIHSSGRVGRRQRDTIMDTDGERDPEFFLLLSFRDREQCDQAIQQVFARLDPVDSVHRTVYSMIKDEIFICWEDI